MPVIVVLIIVTCIGGRAKPGDPSENVKNVGGAMHFIYYINRLTATKVDSTYLGCLTSNTQRICPVAGLERMTSGLAVSALSYRATQVDKNVVTNEKMKQLV